MKYSLKILTFCLLPLFLFCLFLLWFTFHKIEQNSTDTFQKHAFQSVEDVSNFLRNFVVTGNLNPAFLYIEHLSRSRGIEYFDIYQPFTPRAGASSVQRVIQNSPPPNDAEFVRVSDTLSFLDNKADRIFYIKNNLYFDKDSEELAGVITFGITYSSLFDELASLRFTFVFLSFLFLSLFAVIFYFGWRSQNNVHNLFLDYFFAMSKGESVSPPRKLADFRPILEKVNSMGEEIRVYQEELQTRAAEAAMVTVARQVAHDIRSPLAAITMVSRDLQEVPEEKRLLLQAATNRITDISNNLLSRDCSDSRRLSERPVSQLLYPVIESIISEKRAQYQNRSGLSLSLEIEDESVYFRFALFSSVELKRILSNLINNSVEALTGDGKVRVLVRTEEKFVTIKIIDNGKGIPDEILPRVFNRGESFGKEGGSGLGLHHAKEMIDRWKGQIKVESSCGVGTEVTLKLPHGQSLKYFVQELHVKQDATIIVLDDDPSIHAIWRKKISEAVLTTTLKLHQNPALFNQSHAAASAMQDS
jgi:signal transduction histidine kinase